VLIDDIVSSARTMALAVRKVGEAGLQSPVCLGVHGIFSSDALQLLQQAGASRIVTTNTIAHETNGIDVSGLVAEALAAILQRPRAAQAPRAQSHGAPDD
jgi:ribose-phosphate pyrophosphokinase